MQFNKVSSFFILDKNNAQDTF